MSLKRMEGKTWIIKKEAVRGTAEASPVGGRSLVLLPSSEMNLNPNLLPNTKIFGDPEPRDQANGPREFPGTLEFEPSADQLGELLLSQYGQVATDQPDVGNAPNTYRHRFTPATNPEHALYTLFGDRDTASQIKMEGLACGQSSFNFPIDGRVTAAMETLAKQELAGVALTPDFSAVLEDFLFSDVCIDIAGVTSDIIRQASLQVNFNAHAKRKLKKTRDAADIVHGALEVQGTFQLYHEDSVEYQKFIDGGFSDMLILAQGQIIEDVQKATLSHDLPRIKYSAGPISEVDGDLVQDFSFVASKDAVAGYSIQTTLINGIVSY